MANSAHSAFTPARQHGPVTTAIRAMRVQPERPPLRERAAALRERAASLIRKLSDPHLALRDALIQAHADDLAARPICEHEEPGTPRYRAACKVNRRAYTLVRRILALPAPRTPEGLAVVGLALAIEVEGRLSTRCLENEDALASAARAILAATGTMLPPAFLGFGDELGFAAREAAMMAGPGVLPGWAEPTL